MSAADTKLLVEQMARVGNALAILVGLVGAIAVHLIFVGTFLPQIMSQDNISPDNSNVLTALSDILGFAFFWMLALVAVGGVRRARR
ncbi:MAG: hypothetical protein WCB85_09740 [Candidatus Dormiibacterota bacterium]